MGDNVRLIDPDTGLPYRAGGTVPTGAATSAKQDTGNTSLSSIDGKLVADSAIWTYAAATGGISNSTTAVTIKAAAGASVRNYVNSLQIQWDALGAATEVAIRDGAGGTVLWRGKIQAGMAGGCEVPFAKPLKGTANTLLEVVTLTASVSGGVFVNAQGYTGA